MLGTNSSSHSFLAKLLLQKLNHLKLSLLAHDVDFLTEFLGFPPNGSSNLAVHTRFVEPFRILSGVSWRFTALNYLVLDLLGLESNSCLRGLTALLWHRTH